MRNIVLILLIFTSFQLFSQVKEEINICDTSAVFIIVEEMPEFPGGQGELHKFIAQNIQYPPAARENGIQGKIYVRFVVTCDGSIERISIVRKVDDLLEAESIRVIKSMPKWKPGKQRGQPVNVWYTAPIIFVL